MSTNTSAYLLNLFEKVSNSSNLNERSEYERQISAVFNQDSIVDILESIILGNNPKPIKRVTAMMLTKYTRKDFNNRTVEDGYKRKFVEKIISWMSNPAVDIETKEILSESVSWVIKRCKSVKQEDSLRNVLYSNIFAEDWTKGSREQIVGLLIVIKGMAKAHMNILSINQFFKLFSEEFMTLCTTLLKRFGDEVMKATETNTIQSSEVLSSSYIIRYISELIKIYCEELYDNKCFSWLKKLGTSQQYVNIFQGALTVSVDQGKSFFALTNQTQLDSNLNIAKRHMIKVYHKYMKYITTRIQPSQYNALLIFKTIQKEAQVMINALHQLCSMERVSLDSLRQVTDLRDLIVGILRHLSLCSSSVSFFKMFSSVKKELVNQVILPFVTTCTNEKEDFEDAPVEFAEYAYDVVGEHKSKTIKAASMRLLEIMCDKIDGVSGFVLTECIYMLDFALIIPKGEAVNLDSYPHLAILKNTKFGNSCTRESLIDVSMMTLTALYYNICERPQLMQMLFSIVTKRYEVLVNESDLIKSRFLTLIGYYFEFWAMDKASKQLAMNVTKLTCKMFSLGNQQALSHVAMATLKMIFRAESATGEKGIIASIQTEIFGNLVKAAHTTLSPDFFEVILYLLTSKFCSGLAELESEMKELIQNLVVRCLREQEKPSDINSPDKFIIFCWNCLRALCSKPIYIPRYAETLDTALLPLLMTITNKEELLYDDDLVMVLNDIIKLTKQLPPNLSRIVKFYPIWCTFYNNRVSMVVETYNLMMMYFPDRFDSEAIIQIINVADKGLVYENEYTSDLYSSEASLLFQVVIMYLHTKLSEEHWNLILDIALKRVEKDEGTNVYKSRVYNIFMVGFIYAPQPVFAYLSKKNKFIDVLKLIIQRSAYFKTTYDRKVLICGLTSILKEKLTSKQFDDVTKTCIEFIAYNLNVQQHEEFKKLKGPKSQIYPKEKQRIELYKFIKKFLKEKAGVKESHFEISHAGARLLDDGSDSDFDDDSDEDFAGFVTISNDAHLTQPFTSFTFSLNEVDEYKEYHKVMQLSKQTIGKDIVNAFFVSLGPDKKKIILNMLNSKRVAAAGVKNGSTIPRIITQRKRKKKKIME